jgi:hypothetical protein
VAGVILAGPGCGERDGASSTTTASEPETTITSEPETTSTEDPQAAAEADVLAAYDALWDAYLRAGDPPAPDAPFLAEHQTGNMLEGLRNNLRKLQAEGLAIRGSYETDSVVTQLGATTAVVEDCGLDQTEIYRIRDGSVVEDSDDERDGLILELVAEEGSWKVSDLEPDQEVCE